MTDNHNFLALDWVKSEIKETLKQAQQTLEAYIVTPSDTAKLRFCLAYLHQVFGTLQMVEFYGAAMLAEEMERLCLSLVNHKVADRTRAHHALIEAMLQLPAYLERLQVAKKDTPFVLLPIINELRISHEENPISELTLFSPDFARVFSVLGQTGVTPSAEALKKLRHGYQLSLLGIIRQQNITIQYEHLIFVLEKLGLFMGQKPLQALWRMSSALVEALMSNDVPLTPALKVLLGEIEQELRKYIAYPQHSPSLELLKNILYYIAKSRANTHRVLAIRALYHLDDIAPTSEVVEAEKEKLNAPDRQAMQSVIKGVTDELSHAKEVIDNLTYATHPNIEDLQPLLPVLRQIASTLQVLSLYQLQRIISEQVRTLNKALNFGVLPEGALLVVASGLIEVESGLQQLAEDQPLTPSLETFGGNGMVDQVSAAHSAVLRESRTALEKAKEAIVEYISSQWNAEKLAELPTLLNTVRGGLTMLDLSRPAQILGRLSEFVQQHLLQSEYRPSWSEMDTLADIISSVEYYLERVANHHQNNSLLDVAAQSLDKLGYGLVLTPASTNVVERRTIAKTEEEKALPEIEFGEPPPSKLDKTLLNMPALTLNMVLEAQGEPHEETAQEAQKTVISTPDSTQSSSAISFTDTARTLVSMPALSDEMLAKYAQSTETAEEIPPVATQAAEQEDAFSSTMTFNAEDYLLGGKAAAFVPPVSDPPQAVTFEDTESIFKPEGATLDATLVHMAALTDADLAAASALETVVDSVTENALVGVEQVAEATVSIEPTIDLDATIKLNLDVVTEPTEIEDVMIDEGLAQATDTFELTAIMPHDDITDDDEICEIFIEEAEEVLETILTHLPKWAAKFDNKAALTEVRRGFHTLKGSGRMVGAKVVGELAWSIENMLNRVIDKTTTPNAVMMQLIRAVLDVVPVLLANFQHKEAPNIQTIALMSAADLFAKAQPLTTEQIAWAVAYTHNQLSSLASTSPTQKSAVKEQAKAADLQEKQASKEEGADIDLHDVTIPVMAAIQAEEGAEQHEELYQDGDAISFGDFSDESFDVPIDLGEEVSLDAIKAVLPVVNQDVVVAHTDNMPATVPVLSTASFDVPQHIEVPEDDFSQDDEIREIFIEEVEEVLETIHQYYPKWVANYGNSAALTEFRRGFHTLKGSGRMVGAKVEGELAWSVENMLNRVIDKTTKPCPEMTALISHVIEVIPELITNFQNKEKPTLNTSPLMSIADYFARAKVVSMADVEAAIACAHGRLVTTIATTDAIPIAEPVTEENESESEDLSNAFDALAASLENTNSSDESVDIPQTLTTGIDPVLLDIFISEANGYLEEIAQYIKGLPAHYKVLPVTDEMLRALHTLRGSAGMADIKTIAKIAAPMEHLFKDLRVQHRGLHAKHIDLLAETRRLISLSIENVKQGGLGELKEAEVFLARVAEAAAAPASEDDDFIASPASISTVGLVAKFLDLGLDSLMDAPWELNTWLKSDEKQKYIQGLLTELETLANAAQEAHVDILANVAKHLAAVYQFVAEDAEKALANEQLLEDLASAHDEIINIFDTLAACQTVQPNPSLLAQLQAWGGSPVALAALPSYAPVAAEVDDGADAELLEIFLEEAEEVFTAADEELATWKIDTDNKQPLRVLQRHLHTLKGGARMAVVSSLGDLGHELEFLYEDLVNNRYQATQVLIDFLQRCHDRLAQMIDDLKKDGRCYYAKDLVQLIDEYRRHPNDNVILDFFSLAAGGLNKKEAIPTAPVAQPQPTQAPIVPVVEEKQAVIAATSTETDEDLDPEMLSIFLEEAQEIVDETNAGLQAWMQNADNITPVQVLQRGLHTLKGGARMSGVNSLGDLAHEMENIYEGVCIKRYHGNADVFALLQRCHDRIADVVDHLKAQGKALVVTDLVEQLKRYLSNPQQFKDIAPTITIAPTPKAEAIVNPVADVASALPVIAEGVMPNMMGNFREVAKSQQAQEMIRVSSELMEKLINIAGETSIVRSRVEMGVHGFGQTVEEMGATVQRLAEQLRRMQGELESQIMAQHSTEATKYADFDPLEMDQYSSLNQLSKSLYESASDLMDIKGTLIEKARDTETLLLQQSRLNTEMQEGLMSSRLVPFSRLVPRLQRIVRQTASELHKPAELYVINAEGEMDRTLLERIVAPLEHMLRNAVDHGLEKPTDRAAAGKEAMGRISLTLGREGGEIILTLADDGRGVNVDAVRKKAIERGLLEENTVISEKELLQYLFHAGFSTAQKVTQISGRGVGMDVVQSEIKQLGGTVSIQSVSGHGTTFTMRLPFTVAVSRALMVRIGDDVYAIPLSQIEGIVRANPYELETYYAPNGPAFEYANTTYKLHYLGEFVHGVHAPSLFGQTQPLPIMLIRGADQRFAIQVDQLIGSREIVVKSVGAQLASVAGISGATILGDGSVVIILDTIAMLRAASLQKPRQQQASKEKSAPQEERSTRMVMVVDDSVTVRKVTSRLLERHGYEVVLAKDGLDAITKLEDIRPDIMLLDIEMPRMDGFEVASLVRHNQNLTGLPIIMITSRTGEKHRERAFQIGVNAYMGKPFQEQQLLETIAELLAAAVK